MKKNNSQNGFTLIEVLIAIALLAIGILGAATMQISSIGGNSLAIRLTNAATWAGDTHERLMALPYNAATTDPLLIDDGGDGILGLGDTDIPGNLADGTAVQGDYTIFWNVADDYPLDNCKTIRVLVRRNDKGIMKTVTLDFAKMRTI